MEIDEQIKVMLKQMKFQLASLQFGNIDFVIHNGSIIRIDVKNSIKPSKIDN